MRTTGTRAGLCLGLVFLAGPICVRAADTVVGKFNGAGGCAASSCHGSIQPKTVTRVPQNEYSIWAGQDKHARAYQVLSNPVSVRIGKILKLEHPSNQTSRCLACHALSVSPEQRAETFDISDGVSCESCHGPASGWLGQHTVKDWPHERSVKELGMLDMRDLVKRSERCLTCHLGTAEKFVDHELIAAGHPDLTFELNLFSAVQPKHWKEPEGNAWRGVQTWAVGEAVQLRDGMDRLARRSQSNSTAWPEYSELDCFACHHSLTKPQESWRLTTDGYYDQRTVGVSAWNASRYSVFHFALHELDADAERQLNGDVTKLKALLGVLNGNREEIASTAKHASSIASQLASQLNSKFYDSAYTLRVMRDIASDGEGISLQGQRAAEQAAMALDSLFVAYKQNVKLANERDLRTAINQLFQQLDNPSAYDAPRFAAQMQKVSALLGRESAAMVIAK
jgi:hypothetical protein